MRKRIIILIGLIAFIASAFILFQKNSGYSKRVLEGISVSGTLKSSSVEEVFDTHGGVPSEGESLYIVKLNDKEAMDISGWSELPLNKRVAEFYIIDRFGAPPEIKKLLSVEEGYWKMTGKNPLEGEDEKGLYGNVKLYIYDSLNEIVYCYIFDS